MLILTRKEDETILIGEYISIKVVEIRGNQVRLGIEAPAGVSIIRGELLEQGPPEKGEEGN
jgi:carbon storage regulator